MTTTTDGPSGDPRVATARLRGRGGAGFPTGMKWGFVPRDTGKPTYVVVNFDESEPGTCNNRELVEREPHPEFLQGEERGLALFDFRARVHRRIVRRALGYVNGISLIGQVPHIRQPPGDRRRNGAKPRRGA